MVFEQYLFLDDTELVVLPSQSTNDEPSTSAMITIGNLQFIENLVNYFESSETAENVLKDSSKVLLFKLEIEDDRSNFNSTELNELANRCAGNSIVIFLATKDRKRFFIYWKSKEIQKFLMLKIYDECDFMYDLRHFEFITKFLTNSLRRGHLGEFLFKISYQLFYIGTK